MAEGAFGRFFDTLRRNGLTLGNAVVLPPATSHINQHVGHDTGNTQLDTDRTARDAETRGDRATADALRVSHRQALIGSMIGGSVPVALRHLAGSPLLRARLARHLLVPGVSALAVAGAVTAGVSALPAAAIGAGMFFSSSFLAGFAGRKAGGGGWSEAAIAGINAMLDPFGLPSAYATLGAGLMPRNDRGLTAVDSVADYPGAVLEKAATGWRGAVGFGAGSTEYSAVMAALRAPAAAPAAARKYVAISPAATSEIPGAAAPAPKGTAEGPSGPPVRPAAPSRRSALPAIGN